MARDVPTSCRITSLNPMSVGLDLLLVVVHDAPPLIDRPQLPPLLHVPDRPLHRVTQSNVFVPERDHVAPFPERLSHVLELGVRSSVSGRYGRIQKNGVDSAVLEVFI